MGDRCSTALNDLADQRRDLRKQRDEVNRVTRNEERKRARILERARNLSNDDLVAILGSRAVAKASAKPKAKGAAKGKAKAKVKVVAACAAGAVDASASGG
jgi:peptidoglycan hydrolase CwlO-like protein